MNYVKEIKYWDGGMVLANGIDPLPCEHGDFPEVLYHLPRLGREVDRTEINEGPASLWRYAPLLPVREPVRAVTLGEGWTPLLPVPRLGALLRCPHLLAKDEGRNPSGTFKDRGASVAVSRFRELGIEKLVHNSSGNAAGSWGLYAARAGITCVNLVPDDVLASSLQQSVLSGAPTFVLDGPWQESGGMVADAVTAHGWFNMGTLKEPFRLEGKKTMGLEIAEQLDWQLPDAIVYPCGGGLGAIAIYKAFEELQTLGWVESGPLPRLIIAQYEGCAPIVEAFEKSASETTVWTDLDVPPGGLKSTWPPGDKKVLQLLADTNGTAIAVSADEAIQAARDLARLEGIFACPESATTIAALRQAIAQGVVERDARIVLIITGSGLKSIPVFPEVGGLTVKPGERLTTP